ncbi:hypothetical protein ACIQC9_09630 [Brevundimonas sp. NPDC092305]|uniref:hypothetical protein n=1 Tax=Brevundimonas sp. NPDC092305 TaxID=3363957 RepID=UPI00381C0A46
MKAALTVAAASALFLSAVAPQTAQAQSRRFQVVREGDSRMACDVMTDEINTLNQTVRQQQERAQRNAQNRETGGRVGRGLLSGIARGAQVFAYGSTSPEALGGLVASSAASGVATEMANSAGQPAPPPQPLPEVDTPENDRLKLLMGMHSQRC